MSAIGSITAPDRMCAPISEPFSSTHTESSAPRSAAQLLEPDRGRETRRPAADHDHVVLHRLAFDRLRLGHCALVMKACVKTRIVPEIG